MSVARRLSHLQKASQLQPDARWISEAKHELLSEISSQTRLMKAQKLDSSERTDLFMLSLLGRTIPSVTKLVAAFLVIVMGSGVGLVAQASVPGQMLWPIKRSIEKVEVTLAFSPVKETEVHIKHVNTRLGEIDKILEKSTNTDQVEVVVQKTKAIKKAVSHLEKDITSADSSLKVVKEEKKPLQTVELAQKVTSATKEASQVLKDKSVKSDDRIIEKALDEVKIINQEVQKSAINIAIKVHEEMTEVIALGENADPLVISATTTMNVKNINQDEAEAVKAVVTEMIASEINELETDINVAKEKVGGITDLDLDEAKQSAINDKTVVQQIDVIKNIAEEAGIVLGQAKVLLEEGSLRGAADKISESKNINEKAEVVLDKVDQISKENAVKNVGASTTTTPEKINNTIEASTVRLDQATTEEFIIIKPEEILVEIE